MKYESSLIDQIRDRADLLDIIGAHLNIQKKGSSFVALCPFHNDTNPSLQIHPQKQFYKCFSCGAGGNVYTFLMEYENKTFPEAVEFLAQKTGIALPKNEYQKLRHRDEYIYLKDINSLAKKIYFLYLFKHKNGEVGRQYLNARGIGKKTCERFQIGYAPNQYQFIYNFFKSKYELKRLLDCGLFYQKPNSFNGYDNQPIDFFRDRIIFPIHNEKSEVVGFGGRAVGKSEPKYLNTPETILFKKSSLLYGFNFAYKQILKNREVFIVEGYLDVIACQNSLIPAVAPLGTALTSKQIIKLKRYVSEIYLIFDGDTPGRQAAIKATLIMMEVGADGHVILLPEGLDPFDYFKQKTKRDFLNFISSTKINIYDFFIQEKIPEKDLSPAQKKDIAVDMIRNIRGVSSEIIRLELKKKIAKRLQLPDVDKFVNMFTEWEKNTPERKPFGSASKTSSNYSKQPRKKNKMEMDFALFLCNCPKFIKQASAILFPEDFEDSGAVFIYKHLLTLIKEKDIKFHRVLDLFEDEKIKDYLRAYVLRSKPSEEDSHNEKTFQDYLCRIKMHFLDRDLNHLQKEIGLAEASGDFDLVLKRMEEKQLKKIERDNLDAQFRL